MAMWFSKGFRFGPFRLNVGTGGLGLSFGFSGLRIGINRRGVYLSIGKAGFHYRTYLTGRTERVGRDE
jgi:hypothetical protein